MTVRQSREEKSRRGSDPSSNRVSGLWVELDFNLRFSFAASIFICPLRLRQIRNRSREKDKKIARKKEIFEFEMFNLVQDALDTEKLVLNVNSMDESLSRSGLSTQITKRAR